MYSFNLSRFLSSCYVCLKVFPCFLQLLKMQSKGSLFSWRMVRRASTQWRKSFLLLLRDFNDKLRVYWQPKQNSYFWNQWLFLWRTISFQWDFVTFKEYILPAFHTHDFGCSSKNKTEHAWKIQGGDKITDTKFFKISHFRAPFCRLFWLAVWYPTLSFQGGQRKKQT